MAEVQKKRGLRIPHVYTIIFILMVLTAALTWIVPSGSFERQELNGREVTVAGTYESVEKVYADEDGAEVDLKQGLFDVLEAPAVGIQQAVEVVAFILIVGGSFQVITATGAITSGVARIVKKFKSKDILIAYADDIEKRKEHASNDELLEADFTGRQKAVIIVFVLGIVAIVWGLVTQGWYMNEISAIFMAMALLSGIVSGMSEKEIATEFVKGLGDFVFSAVVVGLARGILVIANDGLIIDTVLNALATGLAGIPPVLFTSILYVVDNLLSILVPSSSGIAALTIPIFGPLVELMGLNPEAAVTGLSMGSAAMSLISPTSAMLVAGLGVCKISLGQWWRVSWKFFLVVSAVCLVFTAVSGLLPIV